MSLYERGLKMPSFAVADRIVAAAGFRLDIVSQVRFCPHSSTRVGRYWVPNQLWRGTLPTCLGKIHIHDPVAGRSIRYDLRRRSQRRKLYERLIRLGTPEQMMEWIDGALLVDIWDELSIPEPIRETWQPLIVLSRNFEVATFITVCEGVIRDMTEVWTGVDEVAPVAARPV